MSQEIESSVLNIQHLTDHAFIITVERHNINFHPGQYMILKFPGDKESREYSIYNKADDDYLQFLIRDVKDGYLSPRLKNINEGTLIEMEGPYGCFTLPSKIQNTTKYIFIATGTGISPIHSILTSEPFIDYQVIHGIRNQAEKYQFTDYRQSNYKACVTGVNSNDFHGRVTDYVKTVKPKQEASYYLSGNSAMINDVTNYLLACDIAIEKINTEIYF